MKKVVITTGLVALFVFAVLSVVVAGAPGMSGDPTNGTTDEEGLTNSIYPPPAPPVDNDSDDSNSDSDDQDPSAWDRTLDTFPDDLDDPLQGFKAVGWAVVAPFIWLYYKVKGYR
jgi:hypothetical protein